jgi:signal transduction histidine kinase/putative methionine-R-sulfoxide reductase with GAF domain
MSDLGDRNNLSQVLKDLSRLSEVLLSASPEEFYRIFPEAVCKIFDVPVCVLWKKLPKDASFKVVATHGAVDGQYQALEIDAAHPSLHRTVLQSGRVLSLPNVSNAASRLVHIDEIVKRGWVSLLSGTMMVDARPVGILNVFTVETRNFSEWEKDLFQILVNRAAMFLERCQLRTVMEVVESDRNRLKNMTNVMREMTDAVESEQIWELLYNGVQELLDNGIQDSFHITLAKIDNATGELVTQKTSSENYDRKIKLGKGIVSQAVRESKIMTVPDVSKNEDYVSKWGNARSEIVIPLIDKALIREGRKVIPGEKCIGVLNVESSVVNAFSERTIKRISLLSDDASIRLERLNFYRKIYRIRDIERDISRSQDHDSIMRKIVEAISETLEFEWVNISLIDLDANAIKSKYVKGIDKNLVEAFKRDARHSLIANDIQTDIIKTKEIEVPAPDDTRFDPIIYKQYRHDKFIRVFLPIIEPSSGQAIGTVEAGYLREYRKNIYEQDVIILKSLVDYAAHALERKKSRLIDKITHELKSPIVGIKGNASFVQARFSDIGFSPQRVAIKLQDVLTDCDLLLYQVRQLEYFLGKISSEAIRRERTIVFRDVVIKTIYQLKSYIQEEYSFPFENIKYNPDDSKRINIFTDKVKLNQVVFNLLMNALKYAKPDPRQFKIVIEVEENKHSFIIKFQDWGIGIRESDKHKIFNEGFRSSEAVAKVGGSGLGLNISAMIMEQLGGELKLVGNHDPTEFHLILPKRI